MKIKLNKKFCHRFGLHLFEYKSRNHSLISHICTRCGMNGVEYRKRIDKENINPYNTY